MDIAGFLLMLNAQFLISNPRFLFVTSIPGN